MHGETECGGKAQTNMSPQPLPSRGNKNILWRDFSEFEKKCSFYFLTIILCYSVQCMFFNQHTVIKKRWYNHFLKDVYSYAYYGHFIFPLRLLRMDMNVIH